MGVIEQQEIASVNIRPEVNILSVLKHLNYKTWYALAEFVDNSIQSFFDNKEKLHQLEGNDFKLIVEIEINTTDHKIIIRDNAAGIDSTNYARAFRPANIPLINTGLCEFGMGMKSAACWFADYWRVRTTAIGESFERTVTFDMKYIVDNKIEELSIETRDVPSSVHYTVIELTVDEAKMPIKRTITKIKEHLKSIYREFIRNGVIELKFGDEQLVYTEPKILIAPFYKDEDKNPVEWRKEINFDFGSDLNVKGFAALRDVASTSEAGFALFRRGRVIEGSSDEGFRPEYIFGKSNSYIFQRLFGELHLEGFEVSHTKDGFKWDENLDTFLTMLKEELNREPMRLLSQADGFRKRTKNEDYVAASKEPLDNTTATLKENLPSAVDTLRNDEPTEDTKEDLNKIENTSVREFNVCLQDITWKVRIELSYDPSIKDWLEISDRLVENEQTEHYRAIGLRLSLLHPFMINFAGTNTDIIEPILRIAVAIGVGEVIARESGLRMSGLVRKNINEILEKALSKQNR